MSLAVSDFKPTGKTFTIDVPVVGQYKQDIVQTPDGLRWVHGKGSQDILAIYHEMEPAGHSIHDYICDHFTPGLVFLDMRVGVPGDQHVIPSREGRVGGRSCSRRRCR